MSAQKSHVDSVYLRERDLALFRDLLESRVMTAAHIATLHFNGKREYTKKRLQQLKAAGYLKARERRVNEPAVLFLTRKAFALLREHGILAEYPNHTVPTLERRAQVSDLTIRHELAVMDVKTALHAAIGATPRFSVVEFSTWPVLYQFEARRSGDGGAEVLVKPDGFIRIHKEAPGGGSSEHTFFLEVDRSTEIQDILVSRAGCYLDYYKSGGFAVRNGAHHSAFKEYPFRVLMVFKSAERRNATAERLLQHNPPILTQVCLTTLDEVLERPLGAIWIRPLGYREAVKGSPYEVPRRQVGRQPSRDAWVAKRIRPITLFSEP